MSTITDSRPTMEYATPKLDASAGPDSLSGQSRHGTHGSSAAEGSVSPPAKLDAISIQPASAGSGTGGPEARISAITNEAALLVAPYLALASDNLDEIERARIATENRLRGLALTEIDKGGFGLDNRHKDIGYLAAAVAGLRCDSSVALALGIPRAPQRRGCCAEHDAERILASQLRQSSLYPWVKAIPGAGDKQVSRLLGAVGDPYIRPVIEYADGRTVPARVRSLQEFRSFCGHGDPERRRRKGMTQAEALALGSAKAKMRVRLIAEKVAAASGEPDKNGMARKRSPYRDTYEVARQKYADTVHDRECMNQSRLSPNGCGTRANPEWGALGSPWRPGHQHGAALRKVGKDFLDDLWREAKRLHEESA